MKYRKSIALPGIDARIFVRPGSSVDRLVTGSVLL